MRPALAAAWLALSAWPAGAAEPTGAAEPLTRSSEELVSVDDAWATSGFRLSLSADYELLVPVAPAPFARSVAPGLQLGWRLNRDWSLFATLRYSAAHGGLTGARARTSLEPVWHGTDQLEVSARLGYVGTLLSNPDAPPIPLASIEDAVRAGRDPGNLPTFGHCDGHGVVAGVGAAWLWRVGALFSTGPALRVDAEWVSCGDDDYVVGNVDELSRLDDPGMMLTEMPTVELHQWWFHLTVAAGWVFAWR